MSQLVRLSLHMLFPTERREIRSLGKGLSHADQEHQIVRA